MQKKSVWFRLLILFMYSHVTDLFNCANYKNPTSVLISIHKLLKNYKNYRLGKRINKFIDWLPEFI